jgi:CheY-like chemotaxis protein
MDIRAYFEEVARQLGIICDVATDGDEACALIEEKGFYNIYFLDWKIEGIGCLDLAHRIKSRDKLNPVIIMIPSTEWNSIGSIAREAGVDDFLQKPLFPSAIPECINAALRPRESGPDDDENSAGIADCRGRRVLLAEDVAINREIAQAFLEPTSIEIDYAENGREAVEKFSANPDRYDIILMDVQMPEMDGYEASQHIREIGGMGGGRVPIIAMTTSMYREDIEKCIASGMDDHISKPLKLDEMMSVLKKHLKAKNT